MLAKRVLRPLFVRSAASSLLHPRFSTQPGHRAPVSEEMSIGIADTSSLPQGINYREDFDQGLSEEEKKEMKRFDIYRWVFLECKIQPE